MIFKSTPKNTQTLKTACSASALYWRDFAPMLTKADQSSRRCSCEARCASGPFEVLSMYPGVFRSKRREEINSCILVCIDQAVRSSCPLRERSDTVRPLRRVTGAGQSSQLRMAVATLWVGKQLTCGVVGWYQGAHRLRAALPRSWLIDIVVIAPPELHNAVLLECPTARPVWVGRALESAARGCVRTGHQWTLMLKWEVMAWTSKRTNPPTATRGTALLDYDAVLFTDVDVDLVPAEQLTQSLRARWRHVLPHWTNRNTSALRPSAAAKHGSFPAESDVRALALPDHEAPVNTGMLLIRPDAALFDDGIDVMRRCRFNFSHGEHRLAPTCVCLAITLRMYAPPTQVGSFLAGHSRSSVGSA